MKIGDLWVKLGLKKDEFDKGIKDAGGEVTGFSGKIKGMKGVAINAWLDIAKEAYKLADAFAHTSQRMGDIWDETMSGLKAAWRTFISAINSTDFSGIGKKMADAFKNAKEVAASSDLEFEIMNSIEVRKSKMDENLERLQIQMRNQKISQQARIDAANEYLGKIKGVYDLEEKYRKDHYETVKKAYLKDAQLANNQANSQYLETFLSDIAINPSLVSALDKYSRSGGRTSGMTNAERQLVNQLRETSGSKGLESLAKIAQHYQDTGNEQARVVVDALTKANYAAGAFDKETKRVQNIANQAVTMGSGGGGGGNTGLSAFEMSIIRAKERVDDVLEDTMRDMEDELQDLNESIEFEPIEIVPPDMTEWYEFYNKYKDDLQRMQDLLVDFRDAAIGGFSDAVQELADQFAGLEDINPGKVVQALLTPLADMAIKEGEILLAQGVGVEACKKALAELNGIPAIAAGTALIAIGAAAKSGLAALAKGGTATTSYSSTGSASASQTQTISTEMTVYVTGRLSGSDILLSGQKTQNQWNR